MAGIAGGPMLPSKNSTIPMPARTPRTAPKKSVARPAITHEDVARRAYDLFLRRNGEHGRDIDDWLQAERELKVPRKRV